MLIITLLNKEANNLKSIVNASLQSFTKYYIPLRVFYERFIRIQHSVSIVKFVRQITNKNVSDGGK